MTPIDDLPWRGERRWNLAATVLVGGASAFWILTDFTHPVSAMIYHWPILLLGAWIGMDAWSARRTPYGRLWNLMHGVALALTAGRFFNQWPFSGHALLGAWWAAAPLSRPLRIASLAMIPFSAVTKAVLEEPISDAWTGALVGVALTIVTRWLTPRPNEPVQRAT